MPFTTDLFSQINYWAVVTAGLATFFLGGLWYSPLLFEAAWRHAQGATPEQVQASQSALVPFGFGSAVLAYLAMALVFALLMCMLGVQGVAAGLGLGFLLWLGFVATTGLTVNLFSIRPLLGWMIDAGFQLVFLLLTGTILALWR